MSNQGEDDITVVIGDDTLSQNTEIVDTFVEKITAKQQQIRDQMLKLQGKMEVLSELLMEHYVEQLHIDTDSDISENAG